MHTHAFFPSFVFYLLALCAAALADCEMMLGVNVFSHCSQREKLLQGRRAREVEKTKGGEGMRMVV